MRLAREATSVYELFTTEVDRWQPQCEAREVALSLDLAPDLTDVDLDRMRISQALGNVISNAIHCTEAGGSILLKVRARKQGGIGHLGHR